MTLGEIIKDYRVKHKVSMETVANRCGLSKGYIAQLEKNVNPQTGRAIKPTTDTIVNVCNGLHLDVNKVFDLLDDDYTIIVNGSNEPSEFYINCNTEEEYNRLSELAIYFRGVSEKAQAQIIERAKVLYEIENEDDIDAEVPEEYSGSDAELVKRIRDEDVETTLKDLVNRGTAEMMKRDALDIKNKAK